MSNKATSITDLIHAKADRDLKAHIDRLINPLFEECQNEKIPQAINIPQMPGKGGAATIERPWVGEYSSALAVVTFAYLQAKWRSRYLSEFIAKTESVAQDLEDLRNEIPD